MIKLINLLGKLHSGETIQINDVKYSYNSKEKTYSIKSGGMTSTFRNGSNLYSEMIEKFVDYINN